MSCVLPLVCCVMNVCWNLLMHVEDKFGPICSPTTHLHKRKSIHCMKGIDKCDHGEAKSTVKMRRNRMQLSP